MDNWPQKLVRETQRRVSFGCCCGLRMVSGEEEEEEAERATRVLVCFVESDLGK
jgi:hypothetical protein